VVLSAQAMLRTMARLCNAMIFTPTRNAPLINMSAIGDDF
jgi:hypothetical protein